MPIAASDYLLEMRQESDAHQSAQRVQTGIEEAVTIDKNGDGSDTPPQSTSGGCKGACTQADAGALVDGEGKQHALLEKAQRPQG